MTDCENGAAIDSDESPAGSRPAVPSEDAFLVELGRRVRHMRAVRGMSRKVLSRASGISERYIAQLESGKGNVSIVLLRRISAAMGGRIEDLIAEHAVPQDWLVIRDLLRAASAEQVARAKAALAGAAPGALADGVDRSARRVALIGLRGAGKSTLGRSAAERLGWTFIELNREIERRNGFSVTEIFALYGQEGYRRLEQASLRELVDRPGPMILATAGGIVAEPLTFELLRSSFYTVWLKAAPEEHMARVRSQGDLRPMADDRAAMQELRAILISREPLYAQARTTVDTSGIPLDEAAQRLVQAIARQWPDGADARVTGRGAAAAPSAAPSA
jgi:XRE family transcriptional regulator, aerobic/anaerobic benzoate catabolism transcriptional regulator